MRGFLHSIWRICKNINSVANRPFGPSLLFLVILFAFGCLAFPMVATGIRHRFAKKKTLSYRMEHLYETLQAYAETHNGKLPPAQNWCDELMRFDKKLTRDIFRDGLSEDDQPCHMAFNTNVSNSELSTLPHNTVILFRAEGKLNLNGSEELVPQNRTTPCLWANGKIVRFWRSGNVYETYGVVGESYIDINWNETAPIEDSQR